MKIGFIGSGNIALTVGKTLKQMKEITLEACSSNDLKKAQKLQKELGFKKAYGNYEDLLNDENIELVYINNIPSMHKDCIIQALNHGKNVICEKPFTLNYNEAIECINLAKEKNLFLTEATWTRYMPYIDIIKYLLDSKIIGEIYSLNASLSYDVFKKVRILDKKCGGGALGDIGVYPINFAFIVFGSSFNKLLSYQTFTSSGVDESDYIILEYPNNVTASLMASIRGQGDRNGIIYGEKGYIEVVNINNPEYINVYLTSTEGYHQMEKVSSIKITNKISGYEYEFYESIEAIENRKIETKSYTHQDILEVMKTLDLINKKSIH